MRKVKSHTLGRILAVSPQGKRMYAIARDVGETALDSELELVQMNTGIIGNIYNLQESELTLAEILIPLNLDTDIQNIVPDNLIGKTIYVELDSGGVPIVAHIINPEDTPRTISPRAVQEARFVSKSLRLQATESIEFLKGLGFTEEEIKSTAAELFTMRSFEGKVIKYGDAATAYKVAKSEGSSEVNLISSLRKNIVTGVPTEQLKNKSCHIQIKAFSAK